jgi:hypothetical protein
MVIDSPPTRSPSLYTARNWLFRFNVVGAIRHQLPSSPHTARRFLPFALLLFSTRRPFFDFILLRNPCVRFRRVLCGWYVRFMMTTLLFRSRFSCHCRSTAIASAAMRRCGENRPRHRMLYLYKQSMIDRCLRVVKIFVHRSLNPLRIMTIVADLRPAPVAPHGAPEPVAAPAKNNPLPNNRLTF